MFMAQSDPIKRGPTVSYKIIEIQRERKTELEHVQKKHGCLKSSRANN
jgi:hypothetical protein